ncbi:MAG: hypothetical protein M3Q14_03720 [bacterium]|nr:hypothetical protein [bacterium]
MAEQYNPPQESIEVSQDEWVAAAQGEYLTTEGIGPCIGLAIYDPVSKVGYLGHFAAVSISPEPFKNMLQTAISEAERPDLMRVHISGGLKMPLLEGENPINITSLSDRSYALLCIGRHFEEAQVVIRWLEGEEVGTMEIDCATGVCDIITHEQ